MGDEAAFASLVRPLTDDLLAFLVRMAGGEEDARDLLQETLVRVWRGMPGYRHQGRFAGWVFTIARRVAIDQARKRPQTVPFVQSEVLKHTGPDPLADAEASEFMRDLKGVLVGLSEERRSVFLLRQHGGLTFKEISEAMGIPLGTALSHMHHTIRALRRALIHHED